MNANLPDMKSAESVIPNLHYDLIARAIPGTVTLVFLGICIVLFRRPADHGFSGANVLKINGGLAGVLFLILMALGYTCAIVLVPLGDTILRRFKRKAWITCADRYSKVFENVCSILHTHQRQPVTSLNEKFFSTATWDQIETIYR